MKGLVLVVALAFALAGCQVVQVSRAETGARFHAIPAKEFFGLEQVRQAIDFARIDGRLLSASIFHVTNQRRKEQGLTPLGYLPEIGEAAEMHARSMAEGNYLSHAEPGDPKGRTPWDRVVMTGLTPSYVAENIATHFGIQYEPGTPVYPSEVKGKVRFSRTPGGSPIPNHTYRSFAETLLDQWMGSPPHRQNILSEKARKLGAACAEGKPESRMDMEKFFCVQVFAAP